VYKKAADLRSSVYSSICRRLACTRTCHCCDRRRRCTVDVTHSGRRRILADTCSEPCRCSLPTSTPAASFTCWDSSTENRPFLGNGTKQIWKTKIWHCITEVTILDFVHNHDNKPIMNISGYHSLDDNTPDVCGKNK